jgi:hypothetical protein
MIAKMKLLQQDMGHRSGGIVKTYGGSSMNQRHAFLAICVLVAAFIGATNDATAQTTVADWTFETSAPTTAGPFSPEIGAGSALGFHSGTSTYSAPAGNGSAHSFSSTNWLTNDYYQFTVSTLGDTGLSMSFDQTSSNTGPGNFALEYSTDGTHFTTFGSYTVLANATPNTPWSATSTRNSAYTFNFDLSSITGLDNQAKDYFRLVDTTAVSANGGTVGSGGTDRVDNVSIVAATTAAVPEPGTYLLMSLGLGFVALLSRRRRAVLREA